MLLAEQSRIFDDPGAGARFWALSDIHDLLSEESDRLRADGGTTIVGAPVRQRRRGDPPDADPFPPDRGDLAALRQWVRDWQVRQGRRPPGNLRERAIAAAGAAARDKVAAARARARDH